MPCQVNFFFHNYSSKMKSLVFLLVITLYQSSAILDHHDPTGNEYYGGRKKRLLHGMNRMIENAVTEEEKTQILFTNDEIQQSIDSNEAEKKKNKFFKMPHQDDHLRLPDRFSVLDFHIHNHDHKDLDESFNEYNSSDGENKTQIEDRAAELAFWGRLYLDGFPFPMQYFRSHFGLAPPKGKLDFILADPIEMCNDDFEPTLHLSEQTKEITENVIIVTQRGKCSFAEKALLVSRMGVGGILYLNNEEGNIHPSGPMAHDVNISASMISKNDGLLLMDALQESKRIEGYFVPIRCIAGKAEGLCQPVRTADKNRIQSISYNGTIAFQENHDGRYLSVDFLQANFGSHLLSKEWTLVDLSMDDPYSCHEIQENHTINRVAGNAVLVNRGECDFSQKAKVLANAGAGMMVLANTNNTLARMGFDSQKHEYMPRITTIMVTENTGLFVTKALRHKIENNDDAKIQIKITRRSGTDEFQFMKTSIKSEL